MHQNKSNKVSGSLIHFLTHKERMYVEDSNEQLPHFVIWSFFWFLDFKGSFFSLIFEFLKFRKLFWNQWAYLGGVCFLTFCDLRHFCWSKAGVQNRYGTEGEEEGGKRFLNGQMYICICINLGQFHNRRIKLLWFRAWVVISSV